MRTNRLTVRHPRFDFAGVRRYWAADNRILTHALNAFHVIIPAGERFFMQAVQLATDQIEDEAFAAEVRAFIGQEGWHSKVHTGFWQVLEEQGMPVTRFRNMYDRLGVDLLQTRLGDRLSIATKLSITAALEHYTAILSEIFFDDDFPMEQFDEVLADLHRWHALEELEHKTVAFDLLQQVDPSYRTRVLGFVVANLLIAGFGLLGFITFAAGDRKLLSDGLGKLLGDLRIIGNPSFRRALRPALDYLRPGFHPDQIEDPASVKPFLARFEAIYG